MIPDRPLDRVPDLPPELAALDAELAQFDPTERSSFAPELEAELERSWSRGPGGSRAPFLRRSAAAAVVTLTLAGLAVPPARASLAGGVQRLLDAFQEPTPTTPAAVRSPLIPSAFAELPSGPQMTAPPSRPPPMTVAAPAPEPEVAADDLPAFRPARVSYPTLIDEGAEREVIRRHYPPELQRAGVGGTVRLLLWVAEDGTVENVQTRRNSGVPALDRAAMQGVQSLRFHPATRDGVPVGTYVEFDLVFEPVETDWVPPEVIPVGAPDAPTPAYEIPSEGPLTISVPAPIRMEAKELLGLAIGDSVEAVEARLGPMDGLLAGEPPTGVSPLRWRNDAIRELERAMARDPDNPAPVLALARIRRKQGLRTEARTLFAQGLERAARGTRPMSPRLVAELNYELGSIVRESWWSWDGLGAVAPEVFDGFNCSRSGVAAADIATMVAWNYVCPNEFGAVFAASFEPATEGGAEHEAMLRYFNAAVDVFPAHVGANVAILLDAADHDRWVEVLDGARRFGWATQGHPYSLLLSGLALQRLGRAESAAEDFQRAMELLGGEVAAEFRSVDALRAEGDTTADVEFWRTLDPILTTDVNEREVEHFARAAYAYLRFGDLDSDAASLWLRYGRPVAVRTLGTADLRTEFWDYGPGPDLTLSRVATADERTFTPEADAYLDDLRGVFPHWYGVRARSLLSLPAQAVRFRGDRPGFGELDVTLAVPPALAPADGDSLELGVFVVGADGSRMATTERRIVGDAARVRQAFGPGAETIVVELYNRTTHQAAAIRVPAFEAGDGDEGPGLSDLMLVRAVEPTAPEITRTDAWVTPIARRDLVVGEEVGLLFEVYERAPEGEAPYRVRVELESPNRDHLETVPFRRGSDASSSTAYLILDLAGVQPGAFTLRAVVTYPDGREIARTLPNVRIRTDELEDGDDPTVEVGLESAP